MHINFDAVYQGDSKFARETSKTQTVLIGSILSHERNPPFWCADLQFLLLHILRSSKYIKLIYVFGSAHVKIGVWIKACPQPLFPAEPGVKNGAAEPSRIISAVSNWFRRRTSHELNSMNSIRLMWSTASEPGLTDFTLSNARRFYSSKGDPLGVKGLKDYLP